MATKPEQIKILELKIAEQRIDYAEVCRSYDQAKVKNITFLAAALGLLGYLYTNTTEVSLKDKLFIPEEPYGVIIYALSFALFISALSLLLFALKPQRWSTAYEDGYYGDEDDYLTYLLYINKRYEKISKTNSGSYKKKQTLLDISFLPLLLGGTILLLLKTFGG